MAILECKFYYRQSWIIEFVNLQLSKSNSPIISEFIKDSIWTVACFGKFLRCPA